MSYFFSKFYRPDTEWEDSTSIGRNSSTSQRIVPQKWNYLIQRIDNGENGQGTSFRGDTWLTTREARADLNQLEFLLEKHFAYLNLLNLDSLNHSILIDAIRNDLGASISLRDFGLQIKKLLNTYGDPHTRLISDPYRSGPYDVLPFTFGLTMGRFVGLDTNKRLLSHSHPFISAIDGIAVDSLLRVAEQFVPSGSKEFKTFYSASYLVSHYSLIRLTIGLPVMDSIRITLSSFDEKGVEILQVPIEPFFIPEKEVPVNTFYHERIQKDIGYMKIKKMESGKAFQKKLQKAMCDLKQTKGLIIDIRGNRGGSRDPLFALLPFFITEPKIVNICRIRLDEGNDFESGSIRALRRRNLHTLSSFYFTPQEKAAIQEFCKSFDPAVHLLSNKFSDCYFAIASPAHRNKKIYHYKEPVIILMDAENISASDIFLGAFKGMKNVVLLGTPSSGASGMPRIFTLESSGLKVCISTAASFRPDGILYNSEGISPDIFSPQTLDDFTGKTDTQLEMAIVKILDITNARN